MKERLLLFLNKEEISATTLADEIGVQRSSISHILSGRNNPSYDFILKMLTKYDYLDAEWLITGNGDMYKSDKQSSNNVTKHNQNLFGNFGNDYKARDNVEETQKNKTLNQTGKNEKSFKNIDVTNVNKIEKIVYFYENGTFKEYNPSE